MSLTSPMLFAPAKAEDDSDPSAAAATATASDDDAPPQSQSRSRVAGNLGSVLTQFESSPPPPRRDDDDGSDDGSDDARDRERSLTVGSEFDLGWILGKDGRGMSIVDDDGGLLAPMGRGDGDGDDGARRAFSVPPDRDRDGPGGGDGGGGGGNDGDASSRSAAFASTFLPRPPEREGASSSIAGRIGTGDAGEGEEGRREPGGTTPPARERGDSTASQFLEGIYRHQHRPTTGGPRRREDEGRRRHERRPHRSRQRQESQQQEQEQEQHQQQHQQQQHQQRQQQHQLQRNYDRAIAHTPPTGLGASYEDSHFGKRMRAGSISGRLRSASDLEDTGLITRDQKAILKDLIIAGDGSVQGAIDAYEAGDPSALEEMIRSGALLTRSADVDLLGDLDLDFLNVHGEEDDGMVFGSMDDFGEGARDGAGEGDGGQPPGGRARHRLGDDIGDLEFNGDFSDPAAMEPARVPSGGYDNNGDDDDNQQHEYPLPTAVYTKARGNSIDDLEVHRMRANSLALPGLLLDGANPDDVSQISFGRWTDKSIAGGAPMPHVLQGAASAQHPRGFARNGKSGRAGLDPNQPPYVSSECNVLMASKSRPGRPSAPSRHATAHGKKPKAKKEKAKKPSARKEKKEPRERKSQSKMRDMMESIASNGGVNAAAGARDAKEETKEPPPSVLGRPRSMSDPNLSVRLDDRGLLRVEGPEGWVGAYSPDSRRVRVDRFLAKREKRVWVKKVKYDVRKSFADSRLRVKGRFVKKEDETLMRELMSLT